MEIVIHQWQPLNSTIAVPMCDLADLSQSLGRSVLGFYPFICRIRKPQLGPDARPKPKVPSLRNSATPHFLDSIIFIHNTIYLSYFHLLLQWVTSLRPIFHFIHFHSYFELLPLKILLQKKQKENDGQLFYDTDDTQINLNTIQIAHSYFFNLVKINGSYRQILSRCS